MGFISDDDPLARAGIVAGSSSVPPSCRTYGDSRQPRMPHTYDAKRRALIDTFGRVEAELETVRSSPARRSAWSMRFSRWSSAILMCSTPSRPPAYSTRCTASRPGGRHWPQRPSVREAITDDYAERLKAFPKNHDAWLISLRLTNSHKSRNLRQQASGTTRQTRLRPASNPRRATPRRSSMNRLCG